MQWHFGNQRFSAKTEKKSAKKEAWNQKKHLIGASPMTHFNASSESIVDKLQ